MSALTLGLASACVVGFVMRSRACFAPCTSCNLISPKCVRRLLPWKVRTGSHLHLLARLDTSAKNLARSFPFPENLFSRGLIPSAQRDFPVLVERLMSPSQGESRMDWATCPGAGCWALNTGTTGGCAASLG